MRLLTVKLIRTAFILTEEVKLNQVAKIADKLQQLLLVWTLQISVVLCRVELYTELFTLHTFASLSRSLSENVLPLASQKKVQPPLQFITFYFLDNLQKLLFSKTFLTHLGLLIT